MESEWTKNFSLQLVETSLSAKFIAQILAEKMETSFGRHFFQGFLVENSSTFGSIAVFRAICENV